MAKAQDMPEEGDLVVATVKQVKSFGVVVELDEFPGKEGFIHIAEIASGWVKYIRDHVREGQKIVCKVLNVDERKKNKFVDLSLKVVNDHQKREKIQQWKSEQKAKKLFDLLCTNIGKPLDDSMNEFGAKLINDYGSLYLAFEAASINEDALKEAGYEGEWVETFNRLARENITPPYVEISGMLELSSMESKGMDHIKEALERAAKTSEGREDTSLKIVYVSAPKYRMLVKAPDYKRAEDLLKDAADSAISFIDGKKGTGKFIRKA